MPYDNLLRRLADREMIMPHLEAALLSDKWPESYDIKVDTSPHRSTGKGIWFSPSTHPLLGARQIYYMRHPETRYKMVAERPTMTRSVHLSQGTALHSIIQTQLRMAGLVKPENIEVEFHIPEHHVRGRIDCIATVPEDPELIVEVKTTNTYSYKRIESILPSWDAQLSLAEYAKGKDYGILLNIEVGGGGQIREFRHRRNDALLEEIFDKFDLVHQCIEENTPPSHCCLLGSKVMDNCPAKFECWLKEGGQM